MRRPGVVLCVLLLLGACNQILGNDSDYRLRGPVEQGGEASTTGAAAPIAGENSGISGTTTGGSVSHAGESATMSGGGAAAGESNSGPCTPTGAEDCLNGLDDDCNGDIDCADAACAGPAACVPAPSGSTLGYFPTMGTACAAGYLPVELNQGLKAAPQCTGCTCTPKTADCDASLVASYPGTCPGFQTMGLSYNVFSSHCEAVSPNSQQLHFYSVRGLATCTAGGTGVLSPPTWDVTRTFCELQVGKGCKNGEVCAPKASTTTATCTRLSGDQACSASLGTAMGEPWSTGFTDKRQCTCQCGFGISSCGAAHIQVYSGAGCTGTSADLGNGAADGDSCATPFTPVSGRIVGGAPGTDQCPVDAPASGELLPNSPRTICCR